MSRKKKNILTPAIVILNVLIVLVIAGIMVMMFLSLNTEDEKAETTANMYGTTAISTVESARTTTITTTTPTITTKPVSMTKITTTTPSPEAVSSAVAEAPKTEPPVTDTLSDVETAAPEEVIDYLPMSYDNSFFENSLFIGDSISTGYSLYEYLPSGNVFAKIGLNPETALKEVIGGVTAVEKATEMKPDRIYIMLGSNGIAYMGNTYMTDKMSKLIDALREASPDSVIAIISIPPVTKEHDANKDEKISVITEYNSMLKTLAEEKALTFVNIYDMLLDDGGYFSSIYAEEDGLHFLGITYKVVLSHLQTTFE